MSFVIVGAGITGLTIAEQLTAGGSDVLVLERQDCVGGLCRSFTYGDFTFDVGPHRLFSPDPRLDRYFVDVLDGQSCVIDRSSCVYMAGRYLDWPLSLGSLAGLPASHLFGCLRDLLGHGRAPAGAPRTLEDYVRARYGATILETFWQGYTRKFLGLPCSEVDASWGTVSVRRSVVDRQVEPSGLRDLVKNCLGSRRPRLKFRYPRAGMGVFPERLRARVQSRGGVVRTGQTVAALEARGDRVASVVLGDGTRCPADRLVWTAPLPEACRLLGRPAPALDYLCTVLFNLELHGALRGAWQWVYFPDPAVVFCRVSRPSRFSADTVPAGRTGLCVEVTTRPDGEAWRDPEALRGRVIDDLVRVGLVRDRSAVGACHIERVAETYPVYRVGFREAVAAALDGLSGFRNLDLVGRQALFLHDNIDEAMEDALRLSARLLAAGAGAPAAAAGAGRAS